MANANNVSVPMDDNTEAVIVFNPKFAKATGRPAQIVIPRNTFNTSENCNIDGFPDFIGVGRTGKGGNLAPVDGVKVGLSIGFVKGTAAKAAKPVAW